MHLDHPGFANTEMNCLCQLVDRLARLGLVEELLLDLD
jgi:hypothetical protein